MHSYNKTVGGFNTTLAAFLVGAQANAFWNLGPGGWQCDDWDVRTRHYAALSRSPALCVHGGDGGGVSLRGRSGLA